MSPPVSSAARPARFLPLDGMRAIAALAVALYHLQQRVPHLDARLPRALSILLQHGNLGVQIFFVLSGFAVSRSLSASTLGARGVARFMLRRSIRLDPPYAFTVLLVSLLALRNPAAWPLRPTLSLIAAHLAYLQGVLGLYHLQGVFWTLCIEIQLYLAFAICHAALGRARAPTFSLALLASAILALVFTGRAPLSSVHLLPHWPIFLLGVLAERADRMSSERGPLLLLVLALSGSLAVVARPEIVAGLLSMTLLVAAGRLRALGRLLASPPLLAFGRGSYSFYLVHALAFGAVFEATASMMGSVRSDLIRMVLALSAGALAAFVMHRLLEVPAQRLSRRVSEA